jgi:hypothetical protein
LCCRIQGTSWSSILSHHGDDDQHVAFLVDIEHEANLNVILSSQVASDAANALIGAQRSAAERRENLATRNIPFGHSILAAVVRDNSSGHILCSDG